MAVASNIAESNLPRRPALLRLSLLQTHLALKEAAALTFYRRVLYSWLATVAPGAPLPEASADTPVSTTSGPITDTAVDYALSGPAGELPASNDGPADAFRPSAQTVTVTAATANNTAIARQWGCPQVARYGETR